MDGAEFDAVVAEGLDGLPDRLRRAVELVDIDDLTYAEPRRGIGMGLLGAAAIS